MKLIILGLILVNSVLTNNLELNLPFFGQNNKLVFNPNNQNVLLKIPIKQPKHAQNIPKFQLQEIPQYLKPPVFNEKPKDQFSMHKKPITKQSKLQLSNSPPNIMQNNKVSNNLSILRKQKEQQESQFSAWNSLSKEMKQNAKNNKNIKSLLNIVNAFNFNNRVRQIKLP